MPTVAPLPDTLRDPFHRQINEGLMVEFINRDLLERANLDVRRSVVLYDEHGVFEYALDVLPDAETLQRLHDETDIRYWSQGI